MLTMNCNPIHSLQCGTRIMSLESLLESSRHSFLPQGSGEDSVASPRCGLSDFVASECLCNCTCLTCVVTGVFITYAQ